MGVITKKIVEYEVYVSEDGRETPVREMAPMHLVNAFGKACIDDKKEVIKSLKTELARRLNITCE